MLRFESSGEKMQPPLPLFLGGEEVSKQLELLYRKCASTRTLRVEMQTYTIIRFC